MRLRLTIFIAAIIIIVTLIAVINTERQDAQSLQESINPKPAPPVNLESLVLLENIEAKDNTSSVTSTDRSPDYTKMFPELYTEYVIPKEVYENRKVAYITFDDGPSDYTYDILDILEENDVEATFFITGSSIKEDEEKSLKRMMNEGHAIGIHTYSHICDEIYCSVERFLDDFNMAYERIYDITGERVSIYRFPWGSNNSYNKHIKDALLEEMERRGFSCYDWNVDAKDSFGTPNSYTVLRNIKKDMKGQNYPIILMHDSGSNKLIVSLLPDIIKLIRDMGYEFDTLDHRSQYLFPWGN